MGTLTVIPTIPVAGMALLLGIDRFMSMFRALINMLGNGVATLVVALWEREVDSETLRTSLAAGQGRIERPRKETAAATDQEPQPED